MYAERTEKTASEKDKTGIPRRMKKGFEHSSGFSFDDVRVHYNSEKPAQLHAHAYTQGNEVYVAPGQEKHLPHELGHVVQQKSDMVKPTGEIGGLPLNDDEDMENGADIIAENAEDLEEPPVQGKFMGDGVVQRADDTPTSAHAYNWSAGLASTIMTGLGMIGGIGSFLYSKHAERKHRYIEEIEEYADAACEAREEQIAAVEQFNDVEERTEKAKARSEAIKLGHRIARNYKAAVQKANAMGEITDQAGAQNENIRNTNVQNTNVQNQDAHNADNVNPNNVKGLSYEEIDSIKDKNVKNALAKAKEAYDERVTGDSLSMPQPTQQTQHRHRHGNQRPAASSGNQRTTTAITAPPQSQHHHHHHNH